MFGRKKKKLKAEIEAASAARQGGHVHPTADEYKEYIRIAKQRIELSLEEYGKLADDLKASAKKITRVKGIFSSKLGRRKSKKHGVALKAYNDCLSAYVSASSELNWLIESVNSCYEGLARVQETSRASRSVRVEAEKYSANVMYKKAKHDSKVDGVVMPISGYVK